ncbi:ABC transporter ATP-binding protein [Dactylosporangium sp. CS-047395]|uniref:ABC transporter ATP-binding protein n=1 Tax=Dactylosporangium sp. CS-047395 TaxID=3239936 RepID=UPI003D925147
MSTTTVSQNSKAPAGPDGRPVHISFRDVGIVFPTGTRALGGVTLDVYEGEFLAVVGPSGCGKSTLLNLAAGLMAPTVGQVEYLGAPVRGPNRRVGYVTQKDQLLPWRTVEKNVMLPLEFRGMARSEAKQRAAAVIEQVGLQGFEKSYPGQLSGGMLKRASLARTMAYSPQTYLMDEPFASLDAQLRMVMQDEILRIWRETGSTFVFVTHDLAEAITLADRIVVITSRPGVVKMVTDVHLGRPRSAITAHESPEFSGLLSRLWQALDHPADEVTS